jgi:VWFA-related protein
MLTMRPLIAGLIVAAIALPQDLSQEPFRTGVNVVVAPTIVTDRDGNYVNGLQPHQFRLLDNEKLQDIKVDVSWVPISLVVAIQANAATEPVLPKIKKIAPLFHGLVVGDQGQVAIMAFDHRLQVLQDFTSDADKLQAALDKLKPGSTSSRMVDAVIESARMLRKQPPNRRRVLLLIAETRDHGSEGKVRQALTDLQFENVSVYSVNINRMVGTLLAKPQPPRPDPIPPTARNYPAGVPPTPSAAAQMSGNASNSANFVPVFVEIFKQVKGIFIDNPVEVFTKWTGGREHSFLTQRDLENAITTIGSELHSEYMITYTPNNKEEGGYHTIEVSVPGRDDVKIRTRPGYWMASKY